LGTGVEENDNPYRLVVFDRNGEAVFKTADIASITGISIEDGRLYYMESTSKNVYVTDL